MCQVRGRKQLVLVGYPEEKISLGRLRIRFEDNIQMDLKWLELGECA
jgi:hypothetical protein